MQMWFIVCSCCCLTVFLSLFVEVFKGKNSDTVNTKLSFPLDLLLTVSQVRTTHTNYQSLACFLSLYSFSLCCNGIFFFLIKNIKKSDMQWLPFLHCCQVTSLCCMFNIVIAGQLSSILEIATVILFIFYPVLYKIS